MRRPQEIDEFEKLLVNPLLIPPRTGREKDVDRDNLPKQKAIRYGKDTAHRGGLIRWVKWVVSLSLILTFSILSLNRWLGLNISDSVLIALLTTTTANILGLAYIILKGLFYSQDN